LNVPKSFHVSQFLSSPLRYSRAGRSSAMAKNPEITLNPASIDALLSQRGRFQRFLASRLGSETDAEDILQASMLKALQKGETLRRGERVTPWFFRILRNAVVDHYRELSSRGKKIERLLEELSVVGEDATAPASVDWDEAVCQCFLTLLPSLKPRYAEVLTRVDLRGESKILVRHAFKLSSPAFDVLLHRARNALRKRLEVFCGLCSEQACLACDCDRTKTSRNETA
jgi:RNA polymerase sigma factor (sigma-70 family)